MPTHLNHPTMLDRLMNERLILPTETVVGAECENLIAKLNFRPQIAATVDDMAMIRLLTREGAGIASGTVAIAPFDLDIAEPFFAVTLPRRFPHPALAQILTRA